MRCHPSASFSPLKFLPPYKPRLTAVPRWRSPSLVSSPPPLVCPSTLSGIHSNLTVPIFLASPTLWLYTPHPLRCSPCGEALRTPRKGQVNKRGSHQSLGVTTSSRYSHVLGGQIFPFYDSDGQRTAFGHCGSATWRPGGEGFGRMGPLLGVRRGNSASGAAGRRVRRPERGALDSRDLRYSIHPSPPLLRGRGDTAWKDQSASWLPRMGAAYLDHVPHWPTGVREGGACPEV